MIKNVHDSGGTRTHSLRIRSPARYPLRHGVYCDLRLFKDVCSFEAKCQYFFVSNLIMWKCLFRLPRQTWLHISRLAGRPSLDSSAGRAEDCSWLHIAEILRSLVQIRFERSVNFSKATHDHIWALARDGQRKSSLISKRTPLSNRIWTSDLRISAMCLPTTVLRSTSWAIESGLVGGGKLKHQFTRSCSWQDMWFLVLAIQKNPYHTYAVD